MIKNKKRISLSDPHVTQPYVDVDAWDQLTDKRVDSDKSSCEQSTSDIPENPPNKIAGLDNAGSDMATATGVEHMSEKQGASKDDSSEQSAVLSADRVVVDQLELVDREDKSFHVIRPGRIEISQLGRAKQNQ